MIRTCECCKYSTIYKQVFDKHLQSKRHIELTKDENTNDTRYNECNSCGKKYKSYSALWKHKKECITTDKTLEINDSTGQISTNVVPIILQYLNSQFSKNVEEQNKGQPAEPKSNIEDTDVLENNTGSSNDENNIECKYLCIICNKKFDTRSGLWKHKKRCKKNLPNITISNTDIITPIILEKLNEIQLQIAPLLKVEQERMEVSSGIIDSNTIERANTGEISITSEERCSKDFETIIELENKTKRIEQLEKTYLKKQKRHHFVDNNVIYIVTTEDNKLRRNYIVGKARNLTCRLSTYNKTAEHEVVYHRKCPDEHTMNIIEASVMKKLEKYRECANRDRFILPEDAEISLFTNIIDSCVTFFEDDNGSK